MNILTYARQCEMQWEQIMLEMSGYKRITTFYADLSIAEAFGIKQVRSTYNDVFNAWGKNVKYITEFVLCLNHKIWQHHGTNDALAEVYDELWRKADERIKNYFKGEDLNYIYSTLD